MSRRGLAVHVCLHVFQFFNFFCNVHAFTAKKSLHDLTIFCARVTFFTCSTDSGDTGSYRPKVSGMHMAHQTRIGDRTLAVNAWPMGSRHRCCQGVKVKTERLPSSLRVCVGGGGGSSSFQHAAGLVCGPVVQSTHSQTPTRGIWDGARGTHALWLEDYAVHTSHAPCGVHVVHTARWTHHAGHPPHSPRSPHGHFARDTRRTAPAAHCTTPSLHAENYAMCMLCMASCTLHTRYTI